MRKGCEFSGSDCVKCLSTKFGEPEYHSDQAEKEGTVEPLVPWTVVGRPVDGRRTAAGRSSAARVSSAAPKKNHLIEAAPFGRLDQMLRTTV